MEAKYMRYIDQDMIEDQTGCTLEQFEDVYVLHTSDEIIPLDPVALSNWSPCYDLTVGGMSDDDRWHAKIDNCQSLIESCSASTVDRATAIAWYEHNGSWLMDDLTVHGALSASLTDEQIEVLDDALDAIGIEHGFDEVDGVKRVWAIGPTFEQLATIVVVAAAMGER